VGGAPTGEEPRPDASNAKSQRPATGHKGNWRVPCSCQCVETPVVAHRPFALTQSSIHPVRVHKYVPGRQASAVCGMGSVLYRMCDVFKKRIGVYWGARRQKFCRLRVEELGCVVCGSWLPLWQVAGMLRSQQMPLRRRHCLCHMSQLKASKRTKLPDTKQQSKEKRPILDRMTYCKRRLTGKDALH
jgi:hypothetical protein